MDKKTKGKKTKPSKGRKKAKPTWQQIPVPTKQIGQFDFISLTTGACVARVLSCASDISPNSIPPAWQGLIAPGMETWFRPQSMPAIPDFCLSCVWERTVANLGLPEAWTAQWWKCGQDTISATGDWTVYSQPNSATKFMPVLVKSQAYAPQAVASPIQTQFGVSFEQLDATPAAVHWYRRGANAPTTPFVNPNGLFVPLVGDYIVFDSPLNIPADGSWLQRQKALT
jgi:hypothetical protein